MPAIRSALPQASRTRNALSAIASALLVLVPAPSLAQDRARPVEALLPQPDVPEPGLESFQPGSTRAHWYDCSCYDRPVQHFPYSIVVFEMSQHDLVARPERREGSLTFSPLAHRYGTRYCTLDSERDCYGDFPHPCDFTDFRFGPYLAEYFPTCKSLGNGDT